MHVFSNYVNPYLGKVLENLLMDKEFIKGKGSYLYDRDNNKYLDFIANYGAVPFGYNPDEIWEAIDKYKKSQEPSFMKPSALKAAGELAEKLIQLTPDNLNYVSFTNSGAESVEAAIKLARSATGKEKILASYNSFHGKTLGALSATGNIEYQKAFGAPIAGFSFINYGSIKELEEKLEKSSDKYAAFLLEPIQGEGGIIEAPDGYLKKVEKLCKKFNVVFILDEIQSGLGRTGDLFAFEKEKIKADIILLAKALGGGIIPIGACISSDKVYNKEFALKHSSTFAGNSLAARVGLKTLELLEKDDFCLLKNVKKHGELLKNGFFKLKNKYPELIAEVRGRGLMLGIEFNINRESFPDSLLSILAEQGQISPIISSYLLNKEKLRVAPTLNGKKVIRIEPPLTISEAECKQGLYHIEKMLETLNHRNTAEFIAHLINTDNNKKFPVFPAKKNNNIKTVEQKDEGRFAFLIHPLDLENYREFDKSLEILSENEISELVTRFNDMVEPFLVSKMKIKSKSGAKAYGEFISIPRTTEELINMPRKKALEEIKKAINFSVNRGAKIIGLGAYTSVVSMGGLYLRDLDTPLTTGNNYTVVSAVNAVLKASKKLNFSSKNSTAAIVGATGSIGKGISQLLSKDVSRLLLIGNPKNKKSSINRLYRVAGEIYSYLSKLKNSNYKFNKNSIGSKLSEYNLPDYRADIHRFIEFAQNLENKDTPILITTDINEVLPLANIIVSATSTTDILIRPDNLRQGAVVCDISRPGNVSKELLKLRPDILVIDGGVVEVPGRPSLGWNFGFDKGLAYACMAETMMLALEHRYENMSIGSSGVNLDNILYMKKLAEKHGFKLANFRSFNRPLDPKTWQKLLDARNKIEESAI